MSKLNLYMPVSLLAVVMMSMAVLSCRPTGTSRSKSAADYFVALLDPKSGEENKVRLQVSTPKDVEISLCVTQPSAGCVDGSEKIPMAKVNTIGDRFIHAAKEEIMPSGMSDYLVLDKAGLDLFRFRLKELGVPGTDLLALGLKEFNIENLKSELSHITDDRFNGRLSGSSENEEIADWLIEHLKKLGIKPVVGKDYRQRFRVGVGPTAANESANIIGMIEGSDPVLKNEYIVIGAHMDHAGTLAKGYTCSPGSISGDAICNGADDNGSGTISLLNIAKGLAASRTALKRSVLIMWFSGEEEGLIGSRYYVANPVVPLDKHVYMINLDMVGYAESNGKAISALGAETSEVGKKLMAELGKKYTSHAIRPIKEVDGGSDHAPFFNKGIPGVFFHTGVKNNANYHKTSDHADRIDYEGMLVAAKLGYETVHGVANAPIVGGAGMSLVSGERPKYVSDLAATQGCHYLMNYSYNN